jgi:catechol 2,3-dioxygenase-like lactoylglutathione lyase family enzyme
MILNHLNLTVTDPTETSAFLARHFGLRPGGGTPGMQVLNDDHGMVLTLIKARRENWVTVRALADPRTGSGRRDGDGRETAPDDRVRNRA